MRADVSRETPPPPNAARDVFAKRFPLAERYVEMLAGAGVQRGLIGPREAPRLWDRHVLNCGVLGSALPAGADVVDIGSGAGLPGLALAIARPDLSFTLVEPLLRRVTFLAAAVAALGLDNVEVVRARAEELTGRRDFTVVTSRAVAPLPRLLEWSMPLVRRTGAMMAMKGASVAAEIESARATLTRLGAGSVDVRTYGSGVIEPPATVLVVEATLLSACQRDVHGD